MVQGEGRGGEGKRRGEVVPRLSSEHKSIHVRDDKKYIHIVYLPSSTPDIHYIENAKDSLNIIPLCVYSTNRTCTTVSTAPSLVSSSRLPRRGSSSLSSGDINSSIHDELRAARQRAVEDRTAQLLCLGGARGGGGRRSTGGDEPVGSS